MYQNTGFTLIELLVVVLIIGILSAVALPQYDIAVAKSRVAKILPFMTAIRTAQEAYYLSNGVYSDEWSALDVSIPSGVAVSSCTSGGRTTQCIELEPGISCSLQSAYGVMYCKGDKIPEIGLSYENSSVRQTIGSRMCFAAIGDVKLNKVCKALGGVLKVTEQSQYRYEF